MTRKRTSRRRYGQARTLRRRAVRACIWRRPRRASVRGRARPSRDRRCPGSAGHRDRAGARHSAQRPPRRLDNLACRRTETPAGLRRNRCRRRRSPWQASRRAHRGRSAGSGRHTGYRELAGPDRAQDPLHIGPGVPRSVRRRHQRNRRRSPLQRADPGLQRVQIGREGAQQAVKIFDASRDQVRLVDRLGDIAHHPLRPAGPLPPNPQRKREAGPAKPRPPLRCEAPGSPLEGRATSASRRHRRRSSSS